MGDLADYEERRQVIRLRKHTGPKLFVGVNTSAPLRDGGAMHGTGGVCVQGLLQPAITGTLAVYSQLL